MGIQTANVETCGEYPIRFALASIELPTENPTLSIADNAPETKATAIPTSDCERLEALPDSAPRLLSRLIEATADKARPTRSTKMPRINRYHPGRSSGTAPTNTGPMLPTRTTAPDTKAFAMAIPSLAQLMPNKTRPTPKRNP